MAQDPSRVYQRLEPFERIRRARSQEIISQARVGHAELKRRQQKLARDEPQFREDGQNTFSRGGCLRDSPDKSSRPRETAKEGGGETSDLESRDVFNEQTFGWRSALHESRQHVFYQVKEGLRAGIRGALGPRVKDRVRLARWGQKPEVRVKRF